MLSAKGFSEERLREGDDDSSGNLHYLHRMLIEDSCMFGDVGEDFGERQFLLDDDRAAVEETKSTMSPLLKGEKADYSTFLSKEQER